MFDIVIFKLSKYSYITKKIKIDNNLSFNDIKKYIYDNYNNIVNDKDIVLWIYAGSLINDETDLSKIERDICCYIITDVINTSVYIDYSFNTFLYVDQLNQMLDMGFSNEAYVRDALILSEGRIDDAILMYISLNNS
jgi:hypothetical protein